MIKFSKILSNPSAPTAVEGKAERSLGKRTEPAPGKLSDRPIPVESIALVEEQRLACLADQNTPAADRFRYLRLKLRELKSAANVRTLLVTSALPQDGKTTIALNLATTLCNKGKYPTVLVEADLYKPSIGEKLALQSRPGLAECIEKGVDPMSQLRLLEPLGFHLLSAGKPEGNPTELMQSEALSTVLDTLAARFEWVILDAPPAALLMDAVSLARLADATLVVVRAGVTPREAVSDTVEKLGSERVLGFVFNAPEQLDKLYGGYSGYYKSE